MGNTASQPGTPSAGGTPSAAQPSSSQPSAIPRSASQPIGAGSAPISVSAPAGGLAGGASATERLAFHSGLTPPTSPPSPPPPGTPQLLPHGGHMSPQNPHALSLPQAHDFSKGTVTRLILEAKLAPFYRGIEDFEEDWSLEQISEEIDKIREKDVEEGVANSVTERIKEERNPPAQSGSGVGSLAKKVGASVKGHSNKNDARAQRDKEERAAQLDREKRAYLNATECPICFLSYPPNINTSRCCQQPICTECFVQIKRSDATTTHLESEPACCPFCMETDFGVIYERPNSPLPAQRTLSGAGVGADTGAAGGESALSTSPEAGMSGISQVMSLDGADAELSVGPGMPPKVQESVRRKSVSHKDKQVVTVDEIRPDWEIKLNTVKAAAARRAARRIVMRQVGDKLIPIGYTSSRAPATADFSMSTGAAGAGEEGSRRRRAGTGGNRERDLEELMLLEAMRLSMIDHEDHQRKMHDDAKRGGVPAPGETGGSGASTPRDGSGSGSGFGSGGGIFRKRAGTEGSNTSGKGAASKLLSKLGNRSRSSSTASKNGSVSGNGETSSTHRVSFADQHRPSIGSQPSGGSGSGSQVNLSSPRARPVLGQGESSISLGSGSASQSQSASAGGSPGLEGVGSGPSTGTGAGQAGQGYAGMTTSPTTTTSSSISAMSPTPTSATLPSPSSPLNPRHSINTSTANTSLASGPPVDSLIGIPTPVMERPEPVETEGMPLPRLSADMPPLVPDKVGVPTTASSTASAGGEMGKRGSVGSASHVERTA